MDDTNETWIKPSPQHLESLFRIPKAWLANPKNLFWAKTRFFYDFFDDMSTTEWVDLIAYLHEDDTRGQLFVLQKKKFVSKRLDLNQLTIGYKNVDGHLNLNKKELVDTIAVFEEIRTHIAVDDSESFFSVYDDYDPLAAAMNAVGTAFLRFFAPAHVWQDLEALENKPQPPSLDKYIYRYYLSAYEKTVLKKNKIGIFHFFRQKTQAIDIDVLVGHVNFVGDISQYKLLHGAIQHGMYVNFSVLGVIIELLKQEIPFMIDL